MEKKKVFINVAIIFVVIAVWVLMFFVSIPAGICSVIFGGTGFGYGYFSGISSESLRYQKEFMDKFLSTKEDFFNGKKITISASDTEISAQVVDRNTKKKEEPKKEKEILVAEEAVVASKAEERRKKSRKKKTTENS